MASKVNDTGLQYRVVSNTPLPAVVSIISIPNFQSSAYTPALSNMAVLLEEPTTLDLSLKRNRVRRAQKEKDDH